MTERKRIAILLELPDDSSGLGMLALRRFLKGLIRYYGMRCLSIRPPEDTVTFGGNLDGKDEPPC
ncbi:MAG: hypothetical protein ABL921_23480 [Pirellula sp.]